MLHARTIAVIGGGFSGAVAATHLLRSASPGATAVPELRERACRLAQRLPAPPARDNQPSVLEPEHP